jgi:DNA helicase-2/ATP-dependent DNA helicase PcrA
MNIDIFGDVDKSKLRQVKPASGIPPKWATDDMQKPDTVRNLRKLKPSSGSDTPSMESASDSKLAVGNIVLHERFGKGKIVNLEGVGADKKAEILFDVGGLKKLILRFAKLQVIG